MSHDKQPILPALQQNTKSSYTYHDVSRYSFSLFLRKNRWIWHNLHPLLQMLYLCVHSPFFPSASHWQRVCPIADQRCSYVSHPRPMRTQLRRPTDTGEPEITAGSYIVSDIHHNVLRLQLIYSQRHRTKICSKTSPMQKVVCMANIQL